MSETSPRGARSSESGIGSVQRESSSRCESGQYVSLCELISRVALESSGLQELLARLAECLAKHFAADGCCIALWDGTGAGTAPRACHGRLGDRCCHHAVVEAVLREGSPCQPAIPVDRAEELGLVSLLGFPLVAGGKWLGAVILGFGRSRPFHGEEARSGEHLAEHVSLAVCRGLLLAQARGRSQELEALHQASLHLTSSLDLSEVLAAILEQAQQLMAAQESHVHLWDGERLTRGASRLAGGHVEAERWRLHALSYAVARTGVRTVIPDLRADPQCGGWGWDGAVAGFPLKAGERVVGVMGIVWTRPHPLCEEELRVLGLLADQAALAVENARLFGEVSRGLGKLKRTLEGVISAVVATVEARDPFTAGHQRRVSQLACAVARELDLQGEEVEAIRVAGLVHDLGKMSVPAEILNKPGRLGPLEYELIKRHPQVGHDILSGIELPGDVAEIVLQHHERLDGSGYPRGLRGEDMLLEAKILAVADVVEAIASDRPYRPGSGTEKALEHVVRNRGTLYDREVVDACLALFTEGCFTFDEPG